MARTLTPNDAHAIVNLVMKELTGQNGSIQNVTSDNFVAVGELLNQMPTENVYNALNGIGFYNMVQNSKAVAMNTAKGLMKGLLR